MTNPFLAQFPQPVQHPNTDPAYAAFLASMQGPQAPAPQLPQYVTPGQFAQAYAPPPAPPVAPVLAQGSLDDFYGQPSVGGGASWKFPNGSIGTPDATNVGIVSRAIVQGDISQMTDMNNVPQFFKNGQPKFQMRVPVTNQDGTEGTWYVKGADRDELSRAMADAGAPTGPPEKGAAIRVTYVADRANGGKFATKVKTVEYMRPTGSAPVAPVQSTPQPTNIDAVNANAAAFNATLPTPAPVQAPVAPVQPAPAPAPAAVTLDADQAALLAQLTGG